MEQYIASNTVISKLTEEHKPLLNTFLCDGEEQNTFLINDALEYGKLNLGVTYLLFRQSDNKLLSFITLGMGAIKIPDETSWELHGKKLKEYPKNFPKQFPALRIGQLATQKDEEGRGAASLLILFAHVIAEELKLRVGCAYFLLDARTDRRNWYLKRNFKTWHTDLTGRETITMYKEIP